MSVLRCFGKLICCCNLCFCCYLFLVFLVSDFVLVDLISQGESTSGCWSVGNALCEGLLIWHFVCITLCCAVYILRNIYYPLGAGLLVLTMLS
jgi:hypothetical protein